MVQMTMQVPEELAKRIKPIRCWLPTILELSLVGFKTLATETATEIIQFLSTNPSPQDVLDHHVSDRAQAKLRRLLSLNEAGLLGEAEQIELDEIQQIEHTLIMLKAQLAKQLQQQALCRQKFQIVYAPRVIERAGNRCEYCLLPQSAALHKHEPDHIVPLQHGGETDENNLALACMRCNRYKGPNVGSFDPQTDKLVPLFNPRILDWPDHFELEDATIRPLTAEARVNLNYSKP